MGSQQQNYNQKKRQKQKKKRLLSGNRIYIRKEIITVDEFYNNIYGKELIKEKDHCYDGISLRYDVFKKSTKCVSCGIEGTFFAKEIAKKQLENNPNNKYHFNLYAKIGESEIMMTKDHIKPVCKGGSNNLSNLQTMCKPCNEKKGSKYDGD